MAKILALYFLVAAFLIVESKKYHGIPNDGLSQIDQLRYDIFKMEDDLWRKVMNPRWNEVTDSTQLGPDIEVAKEFSKFCADLESLFPFNKLRESDVVVDSWVWAKLATERLNIDKLYETSKRFIDHQATSSTPSNRRAWLDLAETVLQDPTNAVPLAMTRMHTLVVHSNLYNQAVQESNNHLCELKQSPHQLLFNMYNTIALTEIKGYTTMQFSWMLLKLYGHGNFTTEATHMRQKFEERSAITLAAVKGAMHEASREMWRCDPNRHIEGSTYVAVTRLLQGYVENEVDMNTENTCRENCGYYTHAKNHGCFKDMFCSRQRPCSGDIHDCRYIDSDMLICPSQFTSTRRYEWIEYESGTIYGKKKSCSRGSTKVDSWWRWSLYHCSYCLCICDEVSATSDRYVSLQSLVANITENKVVTGLRFVKENRVIYLQISEGTLEPMGKINQHSMRWKPIEPVNIYNPNDAFHTLVYTNRSVDLDDLEGSAGKVLTGVRFRMLGTHLNLEIKVTPFDFKTGLLSKPYEYSEWISNDNTDASTRPRSKVRLINPDIPTNTKAPSIPNSESNQYIDFDHSSYDADVAQTTVPYLDAQIVMPAQAVPLSGAGIYHKGQKFFGGFIAPKVFTYDYSRHMEMAIPDLDNVIDQ